MPSKIIRWINERWPLNAVIRWSLEEEMPGGASYVYVFESTVLLIFLLQVITGLWRLLYFGYEKALRLGLPATKGIPPELYQLMTLHLRPIKHQPSVEYSPIPRFKWPAHNP